MRFRITSVVLEGCSEPIRVATCNIEDWLNLSLGDTVYGNGIEQVIFTVVATEEDLGANDIRAKGWDKLGHYKDLLTSQPVRYLSFGLSLPCSIAISLDQSSITSSIAELMAAKLSDSPRRLPKGFDFPRLANTVRAAVQSYGGAV